ncbi:hypothetical protein V1514DRAFT_332276 [Lipomyces japonicus]|uniref:uncharacterized protein n=1 Tax=Lipomyces japonicus TaxID=56871 RepID=UPI0034CEB0D7
MTGKVQRTISSLYRRAAEAARVVREALEDAAESSAVGRRPVPVRVPVPAQYPKARYGTPGRSGNNFNRSSWYSARNASTYAAAPIGRWFVKQQVPKFTAANPKFSSLRHGAWRVGGGRYTGGTLHRSVIGYSLPGMRTGSSVRYYSFTSRPMANVVQNITAGIKAGGIGTSKLALKSNSSHFNSVQRSYHAVDSFKVTDESSFYFTTKYDAPQLKSLTSSLMLGEEQFSSYLDFELSPTFALPMIQTSLSNEIYDGLSSSISSHIDDLKRCLADINNLKANVGELPISVHNAPTSKIRIHFDGRHPEEVQKICQDLCITRGIVRSDDDVDYSVVDDEGISSVWSARSLQSSLNARQFESTAFANLSPDPSLSPSWNPVYDTPVLDHALFVADDSISATSDSNNLCHTWEK